MQFRVLSHFAAESYSPRVNRFERAVLIRITSLPQFLPLKHEDEYEDIIHFTFDDMLEEYYNNLPPDQAARMELFTEKHAQQIVNFFDKWKDQVDVVVVHCDAGISRSSAVAIALAEYSNSTEELERMTTHNAYWPNPLVWRTIRKVTGWTADQQETYEELFKFVDEVNKLIT